jgi:hypothetical protein
MCPNVVWLVFIWVQNIHYVMKFMIIGWQFFIKCYLITSQNLVFLVCNVDSVHCLYHQNAINTTMHHPRTTEYVILHFKYILQLMHLHRSFNAATVVVPFPNYAESTHIKCRLNNNQDHGTKHDYCLNNISPNNSFETTLSEEESLMMVTDYFRPQDSTVITNDSDKLH